MGIRHSPGESSVRERFARLTRPTAALEGRRTDRSGPMGFTGGALSSNISVVGPVGRTAIPANFVGLSMEVPSVLKFLGSAGNNTAVAQLLRNLAAFTPSPHPGPVLRLGGNSADRSCWGSVQPSCSFEITRQQLDAYRAFATTAAADVNVSYVIDTNFGRSPDPHVATGHVDALAAAGLWPLVHAVEIGNEMDIYAKSNASEQHTKGHRNASYTYADYEPEFLNYIKAFRAAGLPPRMVQGATYCALGSTRGGFNGNISRYLRVSSPELKTFSYHRYPTSNCGSARSSLPALLSDHAVASQLRQLSPIINQVLSSGLEFWIGEGNSASCGGISRAPREFCGCRGLTRVLLTCISRVSGLHQPCTTAL